MAIGLGQHIRVIAGTRYVLTRVHRSGPVDPWPCRTTRPHNAAMRASGVLLPASGALLAVAATFAPVLRQGREPDVVNLAAGLVLLVAGAALLALAETGVTGRLLVLASMAWFLPDLAGQLLGSALGFLTLLHLVPLVAAVLAAPRGGLTRGVDRGVVALAALAAASAATGGYQVLVPAVGVAVLLAAGPTSLTGRGRGAGSAGWYGIAVVGTSAALAGVPLARATFAAGHDAALFAAYACLIAAAAVALVPVGPWLGGSIPLDVGPDALVRLDRLIAEATGDPWGHGVVRLDEGWVRLDGTPAPPPPSSQGPVSVVARAPVPETLSASVDRGLRLAADNLRSRRLVAAKVLELAALRTRLVRVEDDERAALVGRLRSGPLAALVGLRLDLTAAGASARLLRQVRDTERDLERVAAGLDPLDGFASVADAIHDLGAALGASVTIDPDVQAGGGVDLTTGRALWLACSEGLANALKHAPGALVEVRLGMTEGDVVLTVTDDGPGPGPSRDGGLIGVRDRVAALGGTLTVDEAHPGTRIEVRLASCHHVPESGSATDVAGPARLLRSMPPTKEALR